VAEKRRGARTTAPRHNRSGLDNEVLELEQRTRQRNELHGRNAIRAINRCDSQTILQPSDGAFGRLQQPCRQTWNDWVIDIDEGRCLGLERSIRIIVTASITDEEAGVIREQGKGIIKGRVACCLAYAGSDNIEWSSPADISCG